MLPPTVKEFNVSQRSEEWKFLRGNHKSKIQGTIPADWVPYLTPFRFTASEIYCLTGLNRFKSRKQYMDEVLGITDRTFTGNHHTERGCRMEPLIRGMYEEKHQCSVTEIGFVVPKWCPFIGVSPDGLTEDGCIEIKSPVVVWSDLKEHGQIKHEHYAQMQMTMAICERPWCDYIVYSEKDNEYLEKRVVRDHGYWDDFLYPCILDAISEGNREISQQIVDDVEDIFDSY
jgi:hypothetical protein